MKPAKLFMVLPAYNEEDNLLALLESLEKVFELLVCVGHERRYIIVDDGSRDTTASIIRTQQARLPIIVITHHLNQGLGPTIRDGLRRASEVAGAQDVIFTMDADNTHPPGVMIRMVQMVLEGNDVVIASRYRQGARVVGVKWFRKLMSFGACILFGLVFPIPGVRDYTCGYRAYRASVLKEAFSRYGDSFVESRGFQCMADILLKLRRMKVIMNEVPMILRYDQKGGDSKMPVAGTVVATLKLMLERRFERCSSGSAISVHRD